MSDIAVVDLFCGIGGMTHGFKLEEFHVVAGYDTDDTCKYAYTANNEGAEFVCSDVTKVSSEDLRAKFAGASTRILIGCAPCQPFSHYNRSGSGSKEESWQPLRAFLRFVKDLEPDIVSMENVPQLQKYPIYKEILEQLAGQGYSVDPQVVYCPDYGIPQNRTRFVLLASKLGPISLIPPTHTPETYRTVRDAIKDCPEIEDGVSHADDPLHRSSKLCDLNKRRIAATKEGGRWKDWSDDLILACHKKKNGKTYRDVYGRMSWDKVAPTMTTHCYGLGNGSFGHPEQNRAISLREAALIQTFPKSYKLINPDIGLRIRAIARQIGNAVPVELGRVIAQSIQRHLEVYHDKT